MVPLSWVQETEQDDRDPGTRCQPARLYQYSHSGEICLRCKIRKQSLDRLRIQIQLQIQIQIQRLALTPSFFVLFVFSRMDNYL